MVMCTPIQEQLTIYFWMVHNMTKKQFYIQNLTWGLPMNIIGFLVALALIISGHRPKKSGLVWCFEIGEYWGGLNLGLIILVDKGADDLTKMHEFGHAIQNAKYGLLTPFIVCIPSAIRYWIREFQYRSGNPPKTDYYSIWFEAEASRLGVEYSIKWELEI